MTSPVAENEYDEVSRRLLAIAADLDARLYPYTGPLRRAARLLATAPRRPEPGGCRACGGPVVTSVRGRPRIYCSDRCKRAVRKGTEMRLSNQEDLTRKVVTE